MTVVSLFRHAESMANNGAVTSDPATIPLSEIGMAQAQSLARTIKARVAPDLIVISPYLRSQQTAQPVINRFPSAMVQTWEIQEFTYLAPNRCIDMTAANRRAMVDEYWARSDPRYKDGPGAESFAMFIERVDMAIEELKLLSGVIWVFGHGKFMQAMRWRDEQQDVTGQYMAAFRRYDLENPIVNCSAIEFEFE